TVAERLKSSLGVKPKDRVGLWLKNCPQFIPCYFGILEVGAVVVPINNFLKAEEVGYILKDAGIDVLITDEELATHSRPLMAARPNLHLLKIEEIPLTSHHARHSGPELQAGESDLAVLIYTSGTTG